MLRDVMSVYRIHPQGIWSGLTEEKIYLKYGIKLINFYNKVYNDLTDKSEDYLNNIFLPKFKDIIDCYYVNGGIDTLNTIKNQYSNLYIKALGFPSKKIIRLEKHLKNTWIALKIMIAVCVILLICLVITIF